MILRQAGMRRRPPGFVSGLLLCGRLASALAGVLLLSSLPAASAQAEKDSRAQPESQTKTPAKPQPREWLGTWSATGAGGPLSGTWTATLGDSPYVAYGAWALLDASGKTVLSGTWSASKAQKTWEGSWQARIGNSAAAFAGTWRARSPIVSPASLADLFEFAVSNIATGEWHLGPRSKPIRSGGWAIRAYTKR